MRDHHNISEDSMLAAAKALLKFCTDHDHAPGAVIPLRASVAALDANDFKGAIKHFETMSFGTMGSFDDWFPTGVHPNEDSTYANQVFMALVERFYRLFATASGAKLPPRLRGN